MKTEETKRTSFQRISIELHGLVQGVGFRPFVHRLAHELELAGWVRNTPGGAEIEIEGSAEAIEKFETRLPRELPFPGSIYNQERQPQRPTGKPGFVIAPSFSSGSPLPHILPDLAVCSTCVEELHDPANRRYRHPFINCTHCGPRYTIIHHLPYDRPATAMQPFNMCPQCQAEYEDPSNRRFHAQPIACPECGPTLSWHDSDGTSLSHGDGALNDAVAALKTGRVVAVKGLGGFHLMANAADPGAVAALRTRKQRGQKPFAVMVPDIRHAAELCRLSSSEAVLLQSPEAPIVLLRKKDITHPAFSAAPGNPEMGILLPYTPVHHLIMKELQLPLIATSGNRAEEPICTSIDVARERLAGIADGFLDHNRPILRAVDDSVARMHRGRPMMIRRARGYAPLPIALGTHSDDILTLGPHLKNTVAAARQGYAFTSQHIGDLDTLAARDAFEQITHDLTRLTSLKPSVAAVDSHPDYPSSQYGKALGLPIIEVQHHHAHAAACMAEHGIDEPVLALSWDGTGYGPDHTIWGGEFLACTRSDYTRFAHLRSFALPGGDQAAREPRRAALALLYAAFGDSGTARARTYMPSAFDDKADGLLTTMLQRGIQCPETTSMGRLFDAVSALLGFCFLSRYEGEAAMDLQFAAENAPDTEPYSFGLIQEDGSLTADWQPMLKELIGDLNANRAREEMASAFHNGLAKLARRVCDAAGRKTVVLSGGCFQNTLLLDRVTTELTDGGYAVYRHQRIPTNDGGIAFGQAVVAAARITVCA